MVNITRARPQLSPNKSVTLKTEYIGTRFWNPLAESIPTSHRWISESLYSPRSDSLARLTIRVADPVHLSMVLRVRSQPRADRSRLSP